MTWAQEKYIILLVGTLTSILDFYSKYPSIMKSERGIIFSPVYGGGGYYHKELTNNEWVKTIRKKCSKVSSTSEPSLTFF